MTGERGAHDHDRDEVHPLSGRPLAMRATPRSPVWSRPLHQCGRSVPDVQRATGPNGERGREMNDGASLSSGIASFSIGITLPRLLTCFVVALVLFGLTKLWWSK